MSYYIAEPKTRKELRKLAYELRKMVGLEEKLWIPIVELLDVFAEIFDDFSYEIVPDDNLPEGIHARTDVRTGHIKIRESVYERACQGEGRDRMTIAHEVGHFFILCFCGFSLQRQFVQKAIPAYRDPEWQAKCFAGEFMIGSHLIKGMSEWDIVENCGVSLEAAVYQQKRYKN